MATAADAQTSAEAHIETEFSDTVSKIEFVGMTSTPEGKCLGYEIEIDRGTSINGAILGGLLVGLLALLVSILLVVFLTIAGAPPGLLVLIVFVMTAAGVVSGGRSGADASDVENVTVTVDGTGDVVMVNRRLSPGEFSRFIDRSYDRQTSQFDDAVTQVSKHWLIHKIVDRFLGSRDGK